VKTIAFKKSNKKLMSNKIHTSIKEKYLKSMNYNIPQYKNIHADAEKLIDFRSDTVTRPSEGMRVAMATAKVGDDVYGDDPTVNDLQDRVAKLLGKDAGLFMTSGTQSNLCSMLAHCQRGEEIITGDRYHVYIDEAGGASVLGSIMMAPIATHFDGSISAGNIEKTVKPDDPHCPISKLLCLENTVAGKVQSTKNINECASRAKKFGLSVHLDGARLMNAAVKLNTPVKAITENMDSISLCLSKGLGAPAGSVLVGSKSIINKAYRIRKIVGGGLRQVGILASAGIYALENNIERLVSDHENAIFLANQLSSISEISVNLEDVQTNMVFINVPKGSTEALQKYCFGHGILITADSEKIRLVTHMDISTIKIDFFINKLKAFFL